MTSMRRGEIWQVTFDPSTGAEIRKSRPAVLISSETIGLLPLRVVVPVTSWQVVFARFPWMVRLDPSAENGLAQSSAADTFQVKSVSTQRLLRRMGEVSASDLAAIVRAVGLVIEHP
jgi:mRNA interferase MazF